MNGFAKQLMKSLGAVFLAVSLSAQSAPQDDPSSPPPSQAEDPDAETPSLVEEPEESALPTAMPSASVEVTQREVRAAAIALTDAQRRQNRWDKTAAEAIQLLEKGARDLYRGSVSHLGARIVFMVNGNAIGARRIDGAIQDGKLYTFVEVEDAALDDLVLDLKESIVELQRHKR